MPPKKKADSEVATRQSSRKRKVPDRYDEYVSSRALPDSPEPRSRSNSPASRRSKSKSKKKQESESEDEVPSDFSDEDEVEEESEEEGSENENASESEDDKKKKKKSSRGRSASKSDKSKKTSNGNKSKGKASKSFLSKLDENVRDELEGYNVDELKERLRDNDQVSTGTKGELQERIAESIVDGCFPRCPKCGLGKVKKDAKGYFCPGGYDDDKYKRCSWKSKNVDRPQWKAAKGNLV